MQLEELKQIYQTIKDQALEDYKEFLKFPSISSEKEHKQDVRNCCEWLNNYLINAGLTTEIIETAGHPVVLASYEKAKNQPTLLIYNHYDVQPVDPIELWKTPPFEPTIRDEKIYARGAQDNKGQCFYTILAIKTLLQVTKELPINIKICIEGEEEFGSFGLSSILKSHKEKFKADYLAIVDVGIPSMQKPALTLGVRGITTMDITIEGTSTDLHSGSHGGLAFNPIHALVELLGALRDKNGRITIPGFYDDVQELDENTKKQFNFSFDESEYLKSFGAEASGGEKNYSPLERAWTRPTLEINGISGGYSGYGFKTVIPAKASAKVSCRLVPNQDPKKIGHLVSDYLQKIAPKGIKVQVFNHPGGGKAVRVSPNSLVVKAFAQAYTHVFDKDCDFSLEGGSIPIIPELCQASGAEVVLVGLGLNEDNIHAPNEHFSLDRIEKGFLIIANAIQLLANKQISK
ncbi:Succinyl-diaminopimelate desuccinylase [Candidatus Rubidus massiliensis]|nr:Succinyl-diaminopimelate desuccinylase [Candidatus Rubidus massiliensis]